MSWANRVEMQAAVNREVEERRKVREARASESGRKGREWALARMTVKAWEPTKEAPISPFKKWWLSLKSHLSLTARVDCEKCAHVGLLVKGMKKVIQCDACGGKGWVRVEKSRVIEEVKDAKATTAQ